MKQVVLSNTARAVNEEYMDIKIYDADIQKLILDIIQAPYQDTEKRLQLNTQLYHIAEALDDNILLGFSCSNLGSLYCLDINAGQGISYLNKSLRYLEDTEEWDLISRNYNILGILMQSQGNFISAMESYESGLRIAKAHKLYMAAGKLYHNFSSMCELQEDYEHALYYRKKCLEYFQRAGACSCNQGLCLSSQAMLLRLSLKLQNFSGARSTYLQIEEQLAQSPDFEPTLDIWVSRLEYARWIKNRALEENTRRQALLSFKKCTNFIEYFDECIGLARYLLSKEEYTELEQLLDTLETAVGKDLYAEMHLTVLQYKIQLYELQGRREAMLESSYAYYRRSLGQRMEMRHSFHSALNLRLALNQAEQSNHDLATRADTDDLTGLPNRRKLNEEADRLFELAKTEGKSIALEMLDVDYFKECNDSYGHHMGDVCLQQLADILLRMADERQFCARYGGDEFFIIYYDMTDEEIMKRCEHIKNEVLNIKDTLGFKKLGISQGIMNAVPKEFNKVWDFSSGADESLYRVKKRGRNGIRLIHHASDLKEH